MVSETVTTAVTASWWWCAQWWSRDGGTTSGDSAPWHWWGGMAWLRRRWSSAWGSGKAVVGGPQSRARWWHCGEVRRHDRQSGSSGLDWLEEEGEV